MKLELTTDQITNQSRFKEFAETEIIPFADENDARGKTPSGIIEKLAESGYLGSVLPVEYGGLELDMLTAGLLFEEIGRGSASLLSLLTVHGMASLAISKWGTDAQKNRYLPDLSRGKILGAFGLTEPRVGSDAVNIQMQASETGDHFLLTGQKKWISFGQIADLFVVIAQCEKQPTAFLVEKNTPGLTIDPITDMYGFQSAMLAKLTFKECPIPKENMIANIGFGFTHVAGSVLDFGRYSIACGCVGLAQACLDASLSYALDREQGGKHLRDHQLIQKMLTEMLVNIKAARLLCYHAGYLKDNGDPDSIMEASISKYYASTMVSKVAADAVQIHGAMGVSSETSLPRYIRDSKIMEIIEGSTQIQNIIISRYGVQNFIRDSQLNN